MNPGLSAPNFEVGSGWLPGARSRLQVSAWALAPTPRSLVSVREPEEALRKIPRFLTSIHFESTIGDEA